MKELLFGIYIGLGFFGLVAIAFSIIILINFLAKNNIFFTFVQEGTAKAIMKFNQFHKIIMSYRDHDLDDNWNIIPNIGKKSWFGGLKWVGIPGIHSIYYYNFKWMSFEQREENGQLVNKIIPHEDDIDYILVQDDVYYTEVREAETENMVPLNVGMLLTLCIINPYKALFRVQDWLETTQNRIKPALRSFVGNTTFEELVKKDEELEKSEDSFTTGTDIDGNLDKAYGVSLKKTGIATIDPAGERAERYIAAATKAWEADKESERLGKVYQAVKNLGPEGEYIRTLEAIEKVGQGPSNLVIFPFGRIEQIMKGWLGKEMSPVESNK